MDAKETVAKNFIWRLLERCGAQAVSFIVSIILARMLAPELYGTIALVTLITTVLQVFVDSGMANALIQKKDTDDLDYSSVFYFNVVFCLVLYAGLFLLAPAIARMYKNPELVPIIRVLGITLIISGLKNVQQAYVSKTMQFKRFFFATLGGTVLAAIAGIAMAYAGCGVWALVTQYLLNAAVDTVILWITVKWRPKKMFSFSRLRGLLSYGWKLLASEFLDTGYSKLREFIVGFKYGPKDLALFNRGNSFPSLIMENINASIASVSLPVFSSEQDNKSRMREMTRRTLKVSTYVIMPMMAGLAAVAAPFISLLLTDKWAGCVPYIQVFCLSYAFYPMHTANLSAMKAMGRSDLFLILEVIKKAVDLTALFIAMKYGVFALAISTAFTSILSQFINAAPNKKLIDYSYAKQFRDICPTLLLSLFMGLAVWSITLLKLGNILTLIIQIPLGVLIYIAGSKLLHIDSYDFVLGLAKKFRHKENS